MAGSDNRLGESIRARVRRRANLLVNTPSWHSSAVLSLDVKICGVTLIELFISGTTNLCLVPALEYDSFITEQVTRGPDPNRSPNLSPTPNPNIMLYQPCEDSGMGLKDGAGHAGP